MFSCIFPDLTSSFVQAPFLAAFDDSVVWKDSSFFFGQAVALCRGLQPGDERYIYLPVGENAECYILRR